MSDITIVDLQDGSRVTRPMNAGELAAVQSLQTLHWRVLKLTIRSRVKAAGLIAQMDAGFSQLTTTQQNDWNAAVFIWSDDPTVMAFLKQIGADPAIILASDPDA